MFLSLGRGRLGLGGRRHEGGPGLAGFRREFALRLLRRRRRNHNEMIARGALNLFSAQAFVALQVLIAMRTGKLELAHGPIIARRRETETAKFGPTPFPGLATTGAKRFSLPMPGIARTLWPAWLLLALCARSLAAEPAAVPAPSDSLEPAFQLLRAAVASNEVPGAVALVARRGKILRHEAFGLRDVENQLPFTTNTLCWIA